MAEAFIEVQTFNIDTIRQAMREAPALAQKFAKSEFGRAGKRFIKLIKKRWMSGRPGIEGGQFKKGKHLASWVTGEDLSSLKLTVKASRGLSTHIYGRTFAPVHGAKWLTIRAFLDKKGKLGGLGERKGEKVYTSKRGRRFVIVARVKSVVIPARIPFHAEFDAMKPDIAKKVEARMQGAIQVAFERRVKQITSSLSGLIRAA